MENWKQLTTATTEIHKTMHKTEKLHKHTYKNLLLVVLLLLLQKFRFKWHCLNSCGITLQNLCGSVACLAL